MSSQQLLRLAAALAVVLALWGAVALASRRSEGGTERSNVIPQIDTSRVDSIALVGPQDTTLLSRTENGKWSVGGHAADPQAVTGLLRGLADTATTAELVARSPSSHERLHVSEDSGRVVQVMEGRRTLVDLVAGKPTSDFGGIYLRREGRQEVYAVRGELATALTRRGDDWRDHTIASVSPDSVGVIEVRRGSRSYTLRRKDSVWVLGSGAAADSTAVAGLLSTYREVKAAGFSTKPQRDSIRFSRPRRVVRLLDRRETPLLKLVFDSTAGGMWVRVEEGFERSGGKPKDEVYRLDPWTADQLAPADSTLRKKG